VQERAGHDVQARGDGGAVEEVQEEPGGELAHRRDGLPHDGDRWRVERHPGCVGEPDERHVPGALQAFVAQTAQDALGDGCVEADGRGEAGIVLQGVPDRGAGPWPGLVGVPDDRFGARRPDGVAVAGLAAHRRGGVARTEDRDDPAVARVQEGARRLGHRLGLVRDDRGRGEVGQGAADEHGGPEPGEVLRGERAAHRGGDEQPAGPVGAHEVELPALGGGVVVGVEQHQCEAALAEHRLGRLVQARVEGVGDVGDQQPHHRGAGGPQAAADGVGPVAHRGHGGEDAGPGLLADVPGAAQDAGHGLGAHPCVGRDRLDGGGGFAATG
jgi:hypothetical protein